MVLSLKLALRVFSGQGSAEGGLVLQVPEHAADRGAPGLLWEAHERPLQPAGAHPAAALWRKDLGSTKGFSTERIQKLLHT